MAQPSPDWDLITCKWAGNSIDGSPSTGRLLVSYNGGPMLDDDPDTPLLIFPTAMPFIIETLPVLIDGQTRNVGYVEFQVPASNDPDIAGAGGTYTITEELATGKRSYSIPVDINSPGGELWISKLAPTNPNPGEPLSVVYYSDFTALTTRVSNLEASGGGGGISHIVQVVTGVEPRPSVPVVFWVGGTTQPTNMATGDVWFKEGS